MKICDIEGCEAEGIEDRDHFVDQDGDRVLHKFWFCEEHAEATPKGTTLHTEEGNIRISFADLDAEEEG